MESGKVLYQSYLFPYNVNFVGTEQPDPEDAFQKTDRLLVLDYDGDGKSDIALINDSGINIYTFDVSGSIFDLSSVFKIYEKQCIAKEATEEVEVSE